MVSTCQFIQQIRRMQSDRLPALALQLSIQDDNLGQTSWVTHFKDWLSRWGIPETEIMSMTPTKLRAHFLATKWHPANLSPQQQDYCTITTAPGQMASYHLQSYLQADIHVHQMRALAQLRLRSFPLAANAFSLSALPSETRTCPRCTPLNLLDDEEHFMLHCGSTAPLRQQHPRIFTGIYHLKQLLSLDPQTIAPVVFAASQILTDWVKQHSEWERLHSAL